MLFLQGHGVFPSAVEDLAVRLPGAKVCVGTWLADLVVHEGVPTSRVAHVPNGIDHFKFRVTRPIAARRPQVAMNFDPHPIKGGDVGLAAIKELRAELEVPAVVFGTRIPAEPLSAGVTFVDSPSQARLSADIYNRASVFLQPGWREGFGLCAVEAMACGCALVTADNGGSADYAFDGETALVCPAGDAGAMAAALRRLVRDDALRTRIATNGARFVEGFRWDVSAKRLREVASDLIEDPGRYQSLQLVDIAKVVRRLRG
jgi:glycosyltransferase involved in cell wall biosynthesis